MKEQAYNIIKTKDSRTQRQSNLNKFKKARFKISPQEFEDHTSGEIIWYDEDVHGLRSVETKFLAIVFNDNLISNETLSCEPTVSSFNDNDTDFRISFDESEDEDYTVVFDKNSFSYKIIFANDLKTDSKNDNEKVNMPLFPSPEPKVSCIDDLDLLKYFENEFYNDALTSKSYFLTEPTLSPQHIDDFDLKDETSLSEYDELEQNVLYFNDLFSFNIIYPDDLKSDKDNDDNEIDMIQSSEGNENTQGSKNILEGSHDKINKVFIMKSFVMELNVNIVAWNSLVNGMLFNLIKNLYVPFGISFDPKRYYKDGDCTRMLQRPRKEVHRVQVFDFGGLPYLMADRLSSRMLMEYRDAQGQSMLTSRAWRDPILRLYHRPIACSIVRRSQAPEKVTVTDLFYLRGVDIGSVNIPYLLARYLRLFASGRTVIELDELVRLQICIELADTWSWVSPGPERQPDAAAGAPEEPAKDLFRLMMGLCCFQHLYSNLRRHHLQPAPAQTMAQRLASRGGYCMRLRSTDLATRNSTKLGEVSISLESYVAVVIAGDTDCN
ncbi:hypothetical protein Tco_0464078 [Tanacetum coccineum]